MKSQATVALGQPLQTLESETPRPQGREILLQTQQCGVCHSDLHMHDGYFNLGNGKQLHVKRDSDLPFVLGHEIVGKVVALGPDAKGVELGKSYAVYPWKGCGNCELCAQGMEHLCLRADCIGNQRPGGFADHVLIPDSRYLLDYGSLDPNQAACYMCSGITAYSALRKLEDHAQQGPYLLLGLGGVGMMALQMALAQFTRMPMVADIDPRKLELAREMGVQQVYNLSEEGVFKRIKQESQGLSGLVDFVGAETTLNPAIGAMRQGGKIVVVGLMGGGLSVPIPFLPWKALTIQGSYVGSLQEARELLQLAQEINLAPIQIDQQPLSAASETLDRMRQGNVVGRVVLQAES
ncbi:MAG TPA: alcohol dehydrogenase [Xanthomonadales bacterium]|nr:alcohol dehydrogenase [Xanthomonadales bacterium]